MSLEKVAPVMQTPNKRLDPPNEQNFSDNLKKYLEEYCKVTTVHGLRYIPEKRTKFEKIFWALILLLSFGGGIYMICQILKKYQDSPVVINFATRYTPIYEIPFPSVTICPESKCSRAKFNFSDVYDKFHNNETVTEEELKKFFYLSLLCEAEDDSQEIWQMADRTVGNDFFKVINELKPDYNMLECQFMGKRYECQDIFTTIITDGGICYSFNILGRTELFRKQDGQYPGYYHVENDSRGFDGESGYVENAGMHTFPRRALMAGADNALDIIFAHKNFDTDFICNRFLQGYRILIHNPLEIPRPVKHYFRLPHDTAVIAAVQPELVTTSKEVRDFESDYRKCYLRTERPLKYFKIYTQSNCHLECRSNYTLTKCGCVEFFMPKDNNTAICGVGNFECMESAEGEVKTKDMESKLSTKSDHTYCNCKPLCTDLRYNVETSQSNFYWQEYRAVQKNKEHDEFESTEWRFSALSVYFKAEQFMTLERNELYGIFSLISNFGGLLGLFTGFSLITIVEIIYFLSIRICCNKKLYGLWSGLSS